MSKVTIPIVDISGYLQNDPAKTQEIVSLFRTACQNPGFLQITGHSISPTLRSDTLAALSKFFALPLETKITVHRNQSPCLRGYEVIGEQTLEEAVNGDQKEGFMIGPELPETGRFLQGPNQWAGEDIAPGFREVFMEYFRQVHDLSVKVFRIVALSLGLEEEYFDEFVGSAECESIEYRSLLVV
jgi:isopenicillin N synthase-like dioxygenase